MSYSSTRAGTIGKQVKHMFPKEGDLHHYTLLASMDFGSTLEGDTLN